MKKISIYSIIGALIGIILLVVFDPDDFGWIKKIYLVPKEVFRELSENKNPRKDYSKNFDKSVIERALLGIPKLQAKVKKYTIEIRQDDQNAVIKSVTLNFSESGTLITKMFHFSNEIGNFENVRFNSNNLELVTLFNKDSIKIQEKHFYYNNNLPSKFYTDSFVPNSNSPAKDSGLIVYLKKSFRIEDGSTIKYYDRNGDLKRVFIKRSPQTFPSYIINKYDPEAKLIAQNFKFSKSDAPPKNIISYFYEVIKYAIKKPLEGTNANTKVISEFQTFNDIPIKVVIDPQDSEYEIVYSNYDNLDIFKNWTQFQVHDKEGLNMSAKCLIEYF